MLRFVLLLHLASTPGASEILVLTDGSHMEVAGFETRGNLIVVTTTKGELRSFPASLVNLEATRRANEGISPGEGLDEAHLAKARRALELYGAVEVFQFLCGQFLELAEKELEDYAPPRYHAPFLASARGTFSAPVTMDAAVAHLSESATEAQLDALIRELEAPSLQRVVELEKKAASVEHLEAEEQHRERLRVSPPPPDRRALIERIEAVNGSAELGAQAYYIMFATWEEVAKQYFPNAPTHDLVAFRDARLRKGKSDSTNGLVTYREATIADLGAYATFLESPEGQRFMRLFQRAFDAGLEAAYRETATRWLEIAASLTR